MTGLPVVVREPLTEPDPALLSVRLACVKANSRVLTFGSGTLSRGRRAVHARIVGPGRVGLCQFDRLDVELAERGAGLPDVWMHANRMVHGRRDGLTSAAASLLRAEVDFAVVEFGFHEAWLAAFAARAPSVDAAGEEARCRWEADWFYRAAHLERQFARGNVVPRFLPATFDSAGGGLPRIDVPALRPSDPSWVTCVAELVHPTVAEWRYGWLSEDGRVVPRCTRPRPR